MPNTLMYCFFIKNVHVFDKLLQKLPFKKTNIIIITKLLYFLSNVIKECNKCR